MTAVAWTVGVVVGSLALAVLIGKAIALGNPAGTATDAPDGTAGDLLDDQPREVIAQSHIDSEFAALTDPIEAEIDGRWAS